MSPDARARATDAIRARLWAFVPSEGIIGVYAALKDEIDVVGGLPPDRLAFPRVVRDALEFTVARPERLRPTGPWGIREPVAAPQRPAIDLLVVPGLVFDRRGYRLGYGGGFYDRFIHQLDRTSTRCVGVGFSHQLVDQVPTHAGDARLDGFISDAETLRFRP